MSDCQRGFCEFVSKIDSRIVKRKRDELRYAKLWAEIELKKELEMDDATTIKVCCFCHKPIIEPKFGRKTKEGDESGDSLVIHHINGIHTDDRSENRADAHWSCHSSHHSKGNQHRLGIPFAEEDKKKLSLAKMGNHNALGKHANLGVPKSAEHRRKLSEALKGNKIRLGSHLSEESRKKISLAMERTHHTADYKLKMSLLCQNRLRGQNARFIKLVELSKLLEGKK